MDPLEWVVFGGPAGPSTNSEDGLSNGTQIKMVRRMISHPAANFRQGLRTADVALVELLEPFELNSMVNSICLAEEDIKPGQLCVTAGWADAEKGTKEMTLFYIYKHDEGVLLGVSFHQYLDYLPVPLVNLTSCNSEEHYNGFLDQSFVCTGERDKEMDCRVSSENLHCTFSLN